MAIYHNTYYIHITHHQNGYCLVHTHESPYVASFNNVQKDGNRNDQKECLDQENKISE
jgi:hypothetical protein